MGVLVHIDPFDPRKRSVHTLARPVTVRRLVQKHRGLRKHTGVFVPRDPITGALTDFYGRRRVREFKRRTICRFNDRWLTRREWKKTVVGPRDVVSFIPAHLLARPQGGGFNPLAVVGVLLAVAIAVIAPPLGLAAASLVLGAPVVAGSFAAAVGTAVVGIALSAAAAGVFSLFAQPAPQTQGTGYASSTPASSPVYNLTAQGNYARLQSAIPEAFGRNRLFPDFVSTPYVHFENNDIGLNEAYLHHIVGLGVGEFEIDEDSLKLGDTPITSYPDVEWAVIEPGELSDTDIADERFITCPDVAQIELLATNEVGSDWAGPFAANPAGTVIDHIEVDTAAPRGLWAFNPVSTGLDGRQVDFLIEAQEIDDLGEPVGDPDTWESIDSVSYLRATQTPQRFTAGPYELPSPGRWRVRLLRIDAKDTDLQAGHQLDWIGLRGKLTVRRRFAGMTCVALKMKAGEALNAAQSRQFNLIATRKLETWDDEAGAMSTEKAATRDPCDAFAYIARSSNGGRLADDQIALADLYANSADFEASDWTFDFVFDTATTVSEALARVARAVVAERVTQGGKLHLVRDVPATAPVAMFSPRNIAPGSSTKHYLPRDSTSPDALIGTYIDQQVWQPVDVTVAFDDSAQERPTRLTLHGVGNREQARAVLWNLARADRYRRKVYGWSTAMEGLAVTFGDGISFSEDIPSYGQTLEVIDYDDTNPETPIFTFADDPDFSETGATYYAAVRDNLGHLAGPFVATAVVDRSDQLQLTVLDPADLPEILIGGDKERTWLQLGPGEAYAKPLKVKQVTPRDEWTAEIVAFDDDPRMYDPLPDEPEVPIGVSTEAMTVAVPDGTTMTLRELANDAGYSGLAIQEVTFQLAPGDEVFALRRGTWPAEAEPILELEGTVSGANGAPGAAGIGTTGDATAGGTGGTGGTAIDSSTGPLKITGAGTIRAGKGGGGGGGGGGGSTHDVADGEGNFSRHALYGGDGGAGNSAPGAAGEAFDGAEGGTGGTGGALGADYGLPGSAGNTGADGTGGNVANFTGGAGGSGGAAGKAILGIANVDLSEFSGDIVGATA